MQSGMQAGKCAETEFKVAQRLGKSGEGIPALPGILTPHLPPIGTDRHLVVPQAQSARFLSQVGMIYNQEDRMVSWVCFALRSL